MTTHPPAQVAVTSPKEIWLSPTCDDDAHHGEGRTWAAPAPEDECECDPGGHPWVKYVRADLTSTAALEAEIGRLREAARALERNTVELYRGIAPGGNYGANTAGSEKNESTFADADPVVIAARLALAHQETNDAE